jgi:hypothetical protein
VKGSACSLVICGLPSGRWMQVGILLSVQVQNAMILAWPQRLLALGLAAFIPEGARYVR